MHDNNKGAAPTAPGASCARNNLAVAVMAASALLWAQPSHAFRFGSEEGISGSFDSTLSYGFAQRLQSPDCNLLGGDNGGCNNGSNTELGRYYNLSKGNGYANADINYSNADDFDETLRPRAGGANAASESAESLS
ncbi:DUF1302 family protein [Pseudomonas sp. NY15181]|uniref:DUF1302 family protein n=1 Tax=Pseudomonas sp. NY15181 TaxID=3400349 RepID=UPI003A85330B